MSEGKAFADRIERLEVHIAYLEETIDDLISGLTIQTKEIEALKRQLAKLEGQVADIGAHPALAGPPDAPPPHY